MQRNVKLILSYRGTAYHGFQVQPRHITVCQVLQNAIEQVLGMRYDVKGCSRTDSGVHAARYCVSFRADTALPTWRIQRALNACLPKDVAVLSAEDVPEDFHARYSCKGKRYIYRIWNSPVRNPFWEGFAYHYFREMDWERAVAACAFFVGTYDFAAFCGKKNEQENTVRTVNRCELRRTGELVELTVEGDGFLYNMVRILVGSVLAVSEERLTVEELAAIRAAGKRRVECRTMPAHGLYLDDVFYDT